ncbi:MAG TPA: hypothetical protein VFK69_09990 [Candidatus Eisenbacteria bacterium]|nr:hypothetical protein [Candidatus Eisenbacteria bacterium]
MATAHFPRPIPASDRPAIAALERELEQGMLELNWNEVTDEDRVTFVELVRDRHVGEALARRSGGLAVELWRIACEHIARIHQGRWRLRGGRRLG